MFRRPLYNNVRDRLEEPRHLIQVLAGPRQAGKTTLARQVMAAIDAPAHYASADTATLEDRPWIEQQWELGRLRARAGSGTGAVLFLDEVQKVTRWSDAVKRLWDEDSAAGVPLKVVFLGSSPLLMQRGLGESLAGRFEIIRIPHWPYSEMNEAFGWDLERYLYFGGYPGAAPLTTDPERWALYILDSLIETTVSRDILLLTRVDKPALLRRLFDLARSYSGQVLSYQKMLGQLQDAGNTTTLAHYLDLLAGAGMVTGLQKFSGAHLRRRASSPKLQVLNTALMTAPSGMGFEAARRDPAFWGRLVESAVGAHLLNTSAGTAIEVSYWRERHREVDFVLSAGQNLVALEVKSGRRAGSAAGMETFARRFGPTRQLLVGGGGIPLDEFFRTPSEKWVS